MKITNCEINKNEKSENIITLTFDEKYPFEINCDTWDTLFDNEFRGELNFQIKEDDLEDIQKDPNKFFLNHLRDCDLGCEGLSIYSPKLSKKDYFKLSLKYDCYLGQFWTGNRYDYILFLQMDFE